MSDKKRIMDSRGDLNKEMNAWDGASDEALKLTDTNLIDGIEKIIIRHKPKILTIGYMDFARELATAIAEKIEIDEKKVGGIIVQAGQNTSKYPSKKNLLAGSHTYISHEQYDDLSADISKHKSDILRIKP